jgi:hypothetical protein
MPGFVVHVGATVLCAHAGQAQPTAPFPRVLVSGMPVVTQACLYAVAGCALTGTPNPPCATAQFVVAATRVFAGGAPLVIQGGVAVCVPTATPLNVVVAQTRVLAI